MQEHFYKSEKISHETMRELLQKSDYPALPRFLLMMGLYFASCAAVILTWDAAWWQFLSAQFFFGLMCCSLFAFEHESVHNTAFKTRRLNQVTSFIVGIAHWYASTMFRELHFAHHRYTHEPGLDPEISLGGKPGPSVLMNLPFYLSWLTGFPLLLFKVGMLINGALGMPEFLRKAIYPFVDAKVRWKLMLESWVVLGINLALLYVALYVHAGFWGLFLGQVVGHAFLASYTAAEHNGLPHEGNILEKTRSMRANPLVKFLMWNMPYHAEHHAYPGVPFHALPNLHQEIADELVHKDKNHPAFHLWVFKKTTIGE